MFKFIMGLASAVGALTLAASAHALTYVFSTINAPSMPAGDLGEALSVNDRGQAIVLALNPNVSYDYTDVADIYNGNRHTFRALPANPAGEPSSTQPIGLNNSGVTVGTYHPTGGLWQGYSYRRRGNTFRSVNAFGGTFNAPSGINDQGDIVGSYGDAKQTLGYFYDAEDGKFVSVQGPGAPHPLYSTGLVAINDAGAIVGVSGLSSTGDYPNSFLLLGYTSIPIAMPGFARTNVRAISNLGVIAGVVTNDNFATFHGFIDTYGVYSLVDYPGAVDTIIYGVNRRGWIVGSYTAVDKSVNAFIAIPTVSSPFTSAPVPEPATWALMIVGLGVVGAAMRRRPAPAVA